MHARTTRKGISGLVTQTRSARARAACPSWRASRVPQSRWSLARDDRPIGRDASSTVSCTRRGNCVVANSSKACENKDSLGTWRLVPKSGAGSSPTNPLLISRGFAAFVRLKTLGELDPDAAADRKGTTVAEVGCFDVAASCNVSCRAKIEIDRHVVLVENPTNSLRVDAAWWPVWRRYAQGCLH